MRAPYGITRGQVLKYALLPGILPRLRALGASGFGSLAYLVALVYNTVRILPNNHPYLQPVNIGKYGLRSVVAEAANHIKLSPGTIDQIIIYFAILVGLVMLGIQCVLLLVAMTIAPAMAAGAMPTQYSEFFVTPNPSEDLAFRMLDMVFGVENMFGSKEPVNTSFHQALHAMFEFYSFGLLLVGILILLYFVIAVVAETAESGTPFGKRFNHVWAPIRMVVFFALLIPISSGLNGAQLLSLLAAKYGSGMATNGWLTFNEVIDSTLLEEKERLIASPNVPDLHYVPAFIMLAKTCQQAYGRKFGLEIKGYAIYGNGEHEELGTLSYQDLMESGGPGDVYIRFGELDEDRYRNHFGIYPWCGELVMETVDVSEPGVALMQQAYLDLIQGLWGSPKFDLETHALNFTYRYMSVLPRDPDAPIPTPEYKRWLTDMVQNDVRNDLNTAVEEQIESGKWDIDETVYDYGWAGAAIWYNKVAQQNGALTSSILTTPKPTLYPDVFEQVSTQKMRQDSSFGATDRFSPPSGGVIAFNAPGEDDVYRVLHQVYLYWEMGGYRTDEQASHIRITGNVIVDAINLVLGTEGLFNMCANADIHPLAQLSAVGKGMIDNSIQALGFAVGLGAAGGLLSLFEKHFGDVAFTASSFFVSIAGIGLMLGFILFYIIPFLPFIYFFFAVGSWVKQLFEAMVGAPLWALAHLRIDAQGLPGRAAVGGYFLIFEIFMRPILIVFGLLAGIAIFTAMVRVLNETFFLVLANLSGHEPGSSVEACFSGFDTPAPEEGDDSLSLIEEVLRGPVDEFFFTVVYAIIVYMIGMSCFKLVDMIPAQIMRWMGAEVESFGNLDGEPAEGLVQYTAVGGRVLGGQLQSGIGEVTGRLRQIFSR